MKKKTFSIPPEKSLEELDVIDVQSRLDIMFTKPENQTYKDNSLRSAEYFQEIPLVLVSEALFKSSCILEDYRYELRKRPDTRQQIHQWLQKSKEEDERLHIERKYIPFRELYLPKTEEGENFYRIAYEYGKIPRDCEVNLPQTPEMACWLKTLSCFYQAQSIALAHRLHGVIPDPLNYPDGHFAEILPEPTRNNIFVCTNVTMAWFQLLKAGWTCLKNCIPTSITTVEQLFLEVKKCDFELDCKHGSVSRYALPISKDDQRYSLSNYRRIFCNKPWDTTGRRSNLPFKEETEKFRAALERSGLSGHVRLVLMDHRHQLKTSFTQYYKSFNSKAQDVYIDDFYWHRGKPFKQEKTCKPIQSTAVQHPFGYFEWIWA
ncbi:hypothetical protein [Leptolyngbya sp. KIOST-1]|uniref:hypothetical protein n=1 Tax=Leptolyngbya sp. KIOST-1 TaxID=1229172 RepID=UPI00056CA586|nr:hypothetical protein [Leptolyngbya sp. KIOST-1]